ncbi:MAG: hypothetical protein LBJ97_00150 [Mycoplasmataceae bacterium]|jgi:hypothetical protein|nr:hypothetical protein [Mycoplasmataceae bacterium]
MAISSSVLQINGQPPLIQIWAYSFTDKPPILLGTFIWDSNKSRKLIAFKDNPMSCKVKVLILIIEILPAPECSDFDSFSFGVDEPVNM